MSYFATIIASNRSLTFIASQFNTEVFVTFLLLNGLKPILSLLNDIFCVAIILFKFSSPFEHLKTISSNTLFVTHLFLFQVGRISLESFLNHLIMNHLIFESQHFLETIQNLFSSNI